MTSRNISKSTGAIIGSMHKDKTSVGINIEAWSAGVRKKDSWQRFSTLTFLASEMPELIFQAAS